MAAYYSGTNHDSRNTFDFQFWKCAHKVHKNICMYIKNKLHSGTIKTSSPHKPKRIHFDFEREPWSLSPVVLN